MAKVTNRTELIEYCLRKLGFPVIEINVDDDQIQDRIDDTLEYFADYHYDGTEKTYYAVQVTQADIDNRYISVPEEIIFVYRALPFGQRATSLYPLNNPKHAFDGNIFKQDGVSDDLLMTSYYIKMSYHEQLSQVMGNGEFNIRFNRHTNKVHIDTDWTAAGIEVGDYIMIEGQKIVDPETHADVYNDRWVKRYATAQIKKQWGANLIKYSGIALPGGVTLDGDKLFEEAKAEIEMLEEEMQTKYEEPPMPLMG